MALPVIEIVPKGEYYDYESKYAAGGSEHIIPARVPEEILARAQEIALQCHALLGCRGVSRTDFIVAAGRLYVLEVNTIPGMTPTSLLPQAAEHAGISFSQLLDRLIRSALSVN
jgi:D-alanine-D-alanine ligase